MNFTAKTDCYLQSECVNVEKCQHPCNTFLSLDELMAVARIPHAMRFPIPMKRVPVIDTVSITLASIRDHCVGKFNQGENFYFYSASPGSGKTTWAIKILNTYLANVCETPFRYIPAFFVNIPEFFRDEKWNIQNPNKAHDEFRRQLESAVIVVWDDIGLSNLTKYEYDILYSLINARMRACRSNIFTSNHSIDEIKERVGTAIYSRLSACEQVIFPSVDFRNLQGGKIK